MFNAFNPVRLNYLMPYGKRYLQPQYGQQYGSQYLGTPMFGGDSLNGQQIGMPGYGQYGMPGMYQSQLQSQPYDLLGQDEMMPYRRRGMREYGRYR